MYKKAVLLLVCLYFSMDISSAQVKFNNITVLVNSCDKYSDLWEPFHHFLFEKWPSLKTYNKHVPILFISNSKIYDNPRIIPVNIKNETSWSDTFLTALDKVETDYVLILLEDYILTGPVNEQRLQEIFVGMQKIDAAYIQISCHDSRYTIGKGDAKIPGVRFAGKHDQWRTSLQACIWHKEDLKWLLKKGEGIWAFEVAGSIRSEGMKKPFLRTHDNSPITYLNASQEGYLNADVMRWIRKKGGSIEATKLPINEDHKIKLALKAWMRRFNWNIDKPLKKFVKSILSYL